MNVSLHYSPWGVCHRITIVGEATSAHFTLEDIYLQVEIKRGRRRRERWRKERRRGKERRRRETLSKERHRKKREMGRKSVTPLFLFRTNLVPDTLTLSGRKHDSLTQGTLAWVTRPLLHQPWPCQVIELLFFSFSFAKRDLNYHIPLTGLLCCLNEIKQVNTHEQCFQNIKKC